MADRYWVNDDADGLWNAANNWSATSGGAGGAGVPGASDIAIFDSAVSDNCRLNAAINVAGITLSSYTGTVDGATDNLNHAVSGTVQHWASGATLNLGSGTWTIANFDQTIGTTVEGGGTVTMTGYCTIGGSATVTKSSGTNWSFTGTANLSVSAEITKLTIASAITATCTGALKAASVQVDGTLTATTQSPDLGAITIGNAGTLNMGTGTWNCAGNFICGGGATINASTSLLKFDGGNATFQGNGKTFNDVEVDSTGTILLNSSSYPMSSLLLTAGTIDATSGNPSVAISGDMTANAGTLSMGSGTWSVDNDLTITAGTVTGTSITVKGSVTDQSGTLSSNLTLRPNGSQTMAAGTYGGAVTITLGSGETGTLTFDSGTFNITGAMNATRSAGSGTLTVDANTNNPTMNLSDKFDTYNGGGSLVVQLGTGTWTVAGLWNTNQCSSVSGASSDVVMTGTSKAFSHKTATGSELNLTIDTGATITSTGNFRIKNFTMSGTFSGLSSGVTITGNVLADGTSLSMGNVTWTVAGNWDASAVSTLNKDSSTLVLTGTTKTFSHSTLYGNRLQNVTVSGSYTCTANWTMTGTLIVNGSFTQSSGILSNESDVTLGAAGTLTGAGELRCQRNIVHNGGTWSIAETSCTRANGASSMTAGTYTTNLTITQSTAAANNHTRTFGAGTLNITGNIDFECTGTGTLTIVFNTNNPTVNITGNVTTVNSGGGTLAVTMGSGTWTAQGDIDFSNVTTLTASATPITLSGAGSGTQTIDFDGGTIGALTINDSGATKQIDGGCTTASLTFTNGTVDNSVSNPDFTISGAVLIAGGATWTKGTGTITLSGAGSGTQTITTNGKDIETLTINDVGAVKQLADDLNCTAIEIDDGDFDPNSKTITTSGFVAFNSASDLSNIGGSTWNVGGNFSANGAGVGSELSIPAATTWFLNITGAGNAQYVNVQNSDASGGNEVVALDSIDGTGNSNWSFGAGGSSAIVADTHGHVRPTMRLRMRRTGRIYG